MFCVCVIGFFFFVAIFISAPLETILVYVPGFHPPKETRSLPVDQSKLMAYLSPKKWCYYQRCITVKSLFRMKWKNTFEIKKMNMATLSNWKLQLKKEKEEEEEDSPCHNERTFYANYILSLYNIPLSVYSHICMKGLSFINSIPIQNHPQITIFWSWIYYVIRDYLILMRKF